VGMSNVTIDVGGLHYKTTDFVRWCFRNETNTEVIAILINGNFRIGSKRLNDKLTLLQVGKTAIMITKLDVGDTGTYHVLVNGAPIRQQVKLEVKG